jgi:hypothetical protein
VISLIASLGLNTGGLAGKMDQNVKEIRNIDGSRIDTTKIISFDQLENFQRLKGNNHKKDNTIYPAYFHLVISICYAFFISFGGIIWLYLLSYMIVRYRQRINIRIISLFIQSLGIVLCIFGLFFGYLSARMFMAM